MSQQGPILVVSTARQPSFAATLDIGKLFPVVESEWADAMRAIEQVQPAAVLAATGDTDDVGLARLAARAAARQPYLPLISIDPKTPLPDNFIPFFQAQGSPDRLASRLRAALRGDCHLHSDWSDGGSPVEEMARAARGLGHDWAVLTDHSPSLTVANGLSAGRLRAQLELDR